MFFLIHNSHIKYTWAHKQGSTKEKSYEERKDLWIIINSQNFYHFFYVGDLKNVRIWLIFLINQFGFWHMLSNFTKVYQFWNATCATSFDSFTIKSWMFAMADIKNMLIIIIVIDGIVAKRKIFRRVLHYYIWFLKVFFNVMICIFTLTFFFVTHVWLAMV